MGEPFTIQIYYPDGDPENIRMVNKKGWTGKIFYISRNVWSTMSSRYDKELQTPGIYILAGNNNDEDNDDDIQSIYIGQTENLRTRIDQHIQDPGKSFFQNTICVTESGDFNNAHFSWMEAELIEKSKEIDRCILKNGNAPTRPQIAEPEIVETKQFLDLVLQMLPVVEISVFAKPKAVSAQNLLYSPETSMIPDSPRLQEVEQQKTRTQNRIPKEEMNEARNKILAAFQKRENIALLQRSRSTFYDESKKIRICLSISKLYENKQYWFSFHETWRNFLKEGSRGYVIWGMEGQSKAVVMPIEEFDNISDNFSRDEIRGKWHIFIREINGKISLIFKKQQILDLSNYLLKLD